MQERNPGPAEKLSVHVSKHPFWYASVLTHVLLYLALQWLNPSMDGKVHTPEQRAKVDQSLQRTTTGEMQKHVKNLETMKKLLEEVAGVKTPEQAPGKTPEPQTPAELLAKTEQLSEAIKKIAQEDKAKKLAELLKIPDAEALKKVKEEEKKIAAKQPAKTPAARTAELVEQSKQVLQDKQQELAQRKDGVALQQDAAASHGEGGFGPREGAAAAGGKGMGKGEGMGQGSGEGEVAGVGTGKGGGTGAGGGDKIGEFLRSQLPLPAQLNTGSGKYDLGAHGVGTLHNLGNEKLVKLTGMSVGAGGDATNRLAISNWYIIGPFAGVRNRSYAKNPKYPPEHAVVLDAVYQGKDNRLLAWEYTTAPRYPVLPRDLVEDGVYYGYTEIHMDEARDIAVSIGADDDVRLWVNDQLVYAGNSDDKMWFFDEVHARRSRLIADWNLTEARRRLHFKKGINKLLFKLSNGPEYGYFSLVMTPN